MRPRVGLRAFLLGGLAVAAAIAFLVSPWASGDPDGLERVAIDQGFAERAEDHRLGDSPTADYTVRGVDDERLGTGLSGLVGLVLTGLVAGGVVVLARKVGGRSGAAPTAGSAP